MRAGAGFYINATDKKWEKYRMYDLVTKEIPEVLKAADLGLVCLAVDAWRCGHDAGTDG